MLDWFLLDDSLIRNICRVFFAAFFSLLVLLIGCIDGVQNLPGAIFFMILSLAACIFCGYVIEYY